MERAKKKNGVVKTEARLLTYFGKLADAIMAAGYPKEIIAPRAKERYSKFKHIFDSIVSHGFSHKRKKD
jgi:hypothetical protein